MSRAERKLKKHQAKEELKRVKEQEKQQKIEKRKNDQEAWDNMDTTSKVIAGVVILVIGLGIGWYAISSLNTSNSSQASTSGTEQVAEHKEDMLAKKVQTELNKLGKSMKRELASTRPGGYRGDIISVEPAMGNDTVKVNISTYFKDSGDVVDGGQGIARRIFSNICLNVPELGSLYVVSSSGLESKSVYRSQIPGCKQ